MPFFKARYYPHFIQTMSFLISCLINRNKVFDPNRVKKILIIRVDRLGDFLMSMPVFHALRRNFPDKKITLMVSPNNETLVEGNPLFDEILFYESPAYRKNGYTFGSICKTFKGLVRLSRYDLVVNLRSDILVILFALFKCKYYRIDLGTVDFLENLKTYFLTPQKKSSKVSDFEMAKRCAGKAGFLTKLRILRTYYSLERHHTEKVISTIHFINIFESNYNFNLFLHKSKFDQLDRILLEFKLSNEKMICIHPGAGNREKMWPASNFVCLLNELENIDSFDIVLLYGKGEEDIAQFISEKANPRVVLFNHDDLRIVGALLTKARLLICNDSGIMHLAAAVGTPVFAIFTKTDPGVFSPISARGAVVDLSSFQPGEAVFGKLVRLFNKTLRQVIEQKTYRSDEQINRPAEGEHLLVGKVTEIPVFNSSAMHYMDC